MLTAWPTRVGSSVSPPSPQPKGFCDSYKRQARCYTQSSCPHRHLSRKAFATSCKCVLHTFLAKAGPHRHLSRKAFATWKVMSMSWINSVGPHRHLSRKAFATLLWGGLSPWRPCRPHRHLSRKAFATCPVADSVVEQRNRVPTVTSAERLLRLTRGRGKVCTDKSPPSPQPKGFCDLS